MLEVGLGGRLDATNIVSPIAAAIISIDFDHQAQLGDTLAAIAVEKAGIIKPGSPGRLRAAAARAPTASSPPCQEQGARMIRAADAVRCRTADGDDRQSATASSLTSASRCAGATRWPNAAVAMSLLDELAALARGPAPRSRAGLSRAVWPARLERLLVAADVLLDAAHNPGWRARAGGLLE